VNVAFGGTLVQDIPIELPHALAHETDAPRDARVHDVAITPGSRLAAAAGTTLVRVNSSHHQALARIGDGLRVTAAAPDGIIEGVEWGDGDWWMVGVQWHPEELVDTPERWDRRLFDAFAAECAARAAVTA
jgi:putative glutamine amidotransferase